MKDERNPSNRKLFEYLREEEPKAGDKIMRDFTLIKTRKNMKVRNFKLISQKVTWQNDSNATLHVFQEQTGVKELQEKRMATIFYKRMVSNISHQLKTPLNSILGTLNLSKKYLAQISQKLKSRRPDWLEKKVKFLEKQNELGLVSSELMNYFVSDIITYTMIQVNEFVLHVYPFKISEIVDEMKRLFVWETNSRHLTLEFDYEESLGDLTVYSD